MDSCHGENDELDDRRPGTVHPVRHLRDRVPHELQEIEGTITSDASVATCSLCGHCVVLCPTEAITHHKMNMGNFVALDKGVGYDFDGFKSFVRGRRSSSFYMLLTGNR